MTSTPRTPPDMSAPSGRHELVSELDRYLFNEGRHHRLYECLGAHLSGDARDSARFAVWAPHATSVSVVHDHNGWTAGRDPLVSQGTSGIWAGVVEGVGAGTRYKYSIVSSEGRREKADPLAFAAEHSPGTASVLTSLDYPWHDEPWMASRAARQSDDRPVSVYEVHLGSWQRHDDGSFLSYEELGSSLAEHVAAMGFTHVELLPVMEHPFYGSWGYQTTGFFAPTARHGPPSGLMALVDTLHGAGIGVLLDWVPSHFATDGFALGAFDGSHLYEHADPGRAVHPDWGSFVFNYGRHEVRSFLTSSACFWLDRYHADGIRVDAVASMLYLDYSREPGDWTPNAFGGREDLDAIRFLGEMNDAVHSGFPGVLTVAEESTAWPGVTRPTGDGGLGFSLKWDMGWMHDTLTHLSRQPIHRRHHHDELTFRALYATSERYLLPLSHDEVVHGKGALLTKVPGDDWQRRASLRLLLGYQILVPGKKLVFMGNELGTAKEWDHEAALEWSLLDDPAHAGVARFLADANRRYRDVEPLHGDDFGQDGFSWVIADGADDGVLAWLRRGRSSQVALAIANFTPVVRSRRIGVPFAGRWEEILNGDAVQYGGSGVGNLGELYADEVPWDSQGASVVCTIPPLAVVALVGDAAFAVRPRP